MEKKKQFILLFVLLFVLCAFVIPYFVLEHIHTREALQTLIVSWGAWGFVLYTLIAITCTVVLPLNFTIVGLAGGFIYGTPVAFALLWIARVLGNGINFLLGKHFGRAILKVFITEENVHKYDKLLSSEKTLLLYFVLCFLPGLPGDYAAYFLGSSKIKKVPFIFVTLVGNVGTAFSCAYVGSGKAFTDPLFLAVFILVFLSGLTWIHRLRKKFNLV